MNPRLINCWRRSPLARWRQRLPGVEAALIVQELIKPMLDDPSLGALDEKAFGPRDREVAAKLHPRDHTGAAPSCSRNWPLSTRCPAIHCSFADGAFTTLTFEHRGRRNRGDGAIVFAGRQYFENLGRIDHSGRTGEPAHGTIGIFGGGIRIGIGQGDRHDLAGTLRGEFGPRYRCPGANARGRARHRHWAS